MAKQRLTKNQREYLRQIKLIKRSIKYVERKYNMTTTLGDLIPNYSEGKLPQRITKSMLKNLATTRSKKIRSVALPIHDIIEDIANMINQIPDFRYFRKKGNPPITLSFVEEKQELLNWLYDNSIGDDNYIAYLESRFQELSENFEGILYDSDQDNVVNSIVKAGEIIKGTNLTIFENMDFSDYDE